MEVTVNGEKKNFDTPITVSALLEELGIDSETIVVEKNLQIIPRDAFDTENLADGDSYEIIRFVGGG